MPNPSPMEIRVIERDGRLILQQWRNVGMAYEYEWVDVVELPKGASVARLFDPEAEKE